MQKLKFKKISLKDWEKVGEGGNAESFFHKKDKTRVLKLAKTGKLAVDKIFEEADVSKVAISLGIKTPKVLGYVTCDDRYGIIYERLVGKKSFGKLCHDNPDKIEEYAKIYARELAKLHKIKRGKKEVRSKKKQLMDKAKLITNKKHRDIVLTYLKELKDVDTIIHGDASLGNLLQVGKKLYWIDLGTMMYGDPIVDIGIAFLSYTYFIKVKFIQNLFHVTKKQAFEFYQSFIKEYAKVTKKTEKEVDLGAKKVAVAYLYLLGYTDIPLFLGKILIRIIFGIKANLLIKEIKKLDK
ncbi:MAG: phosphotransferase [Lachnospiraceae bacterium]|nr:phosphotransferase [Lachnospiraceae bacterium]